MLFCQHHLTQSKEIWSSQTLAKVLVLAHGRPRRVTASRPGAVESLGCRAFLFQVGIWRYVEVYDPMSAVPWRQGHCLGVTESRAGGCRRLVLPWGLWILAAPLPDCLLLFQDYIFLGCLSVLLISITSFIPSIASHDLLGECPQVSSWYFPPAFFSFFLLLKKFLLHFLPNK